MQTPKELRTLLNITNDSILDDMIKMYRLAPEDFDMSALHPKVKMDCENVAGAFNNVKPFYVLGHIINNVSTLSGRNAEIQFPGGNNIKSNSYIVMVMGSSAGKTHIMKKFKKPLEDYDTMRRDQFREREARYLDYMDKKTEKTDVEFLTNSEYLRLKKELKELGESGMNPTRVSEIEHDLDNKVYRVMQNHDMKISSVSDINIPRLMSALSNSAVSLRFDEISEFIRIFKLNDKREDQSSVMMALYDDYSVKQDRVGGENSFSCDNANLTILLTAQPVKLKTCFTENDRYTTGFSPRFWLFINDIDTSEFLVDEADEEAMEDASEDMQIYSHSMFKWLISNFMSTDRRLECYLSAEARTHFFHFKSLLKNLVGLAAHENSEELVIRFGKDLNAAVKLSLILHLASLGFDQPPMEGNKKPGDVFTPDVREIGADTFITAFNIVRVLFNNQFTIWADVSSNQNPLSKATQKKVGKNTLLLIDAARKMKMTNKDIGLASLTEIIETVWGTTSADPEAIEQSKNKIKKHKHWFSKVGDEWVVINPDGTYKIKDPNKIK